MLKNLTRALRLPFISASTLPFIFGSLIHRTVFNKVGFLLGLTTVIMTHLSANLINDYADSKSGADWQDKKFYKFFGGSKLIQAGILSEKFYFKTALFFATIATLSAILLAVNLNSLSVIGLFSIILFLGWSYSVKPIQFSYHRLGEVIIFVLFGPVVVMGGYFIQTKIFPDLRSFLLSLPFGFLTTAILYVNEVPDFFGDKSVGKLTWVSLSRGRAFLIYDLLTKAAFLAVLALVGLRLLNLFALSALLSIMFTHRSANIIRNYPQDKMKLIEASKLTITAQALVTVILIISLIV